MCELKQGLSNTVHQSEGVPSVLTVLNTMAEAERSTQNRTTRTIKTCLLRLQVSCSRNHQATNIDCPSCSLYSTVHVHAAHCIASVRPVVALLGRKSNQLPCTSYVALSWSSVAKDWSSIHTLRILEAQLQPNNHLFQSFFKLVEKIGSVSNSSMLYTDWYMHFRNPHQSKRTLRKFKNERFPSLLFIGSYRE